MSVSKYETAKGTRWCVSYTKEDGSRTRKRGFLSKSAARAWETRRGSEILSGEWVEEAGGNRTVAELGDVWIERKNYLKPSSMPPLTNAYWNHVRPYWGDRQLKSIRHSEVAGWVDGLMTLKGDRPLSATGKRYAYQVLSSILREAVRDGLIPSNPAEGVSLPRKVKRRNQYLTARELHEFAAACGDYELLVLLLGYTGLRWGEAIALTGDDVNVATRRISVTRNAVWVNGRVEVGTPKTHEYRTVPIPRFLVARLGDAAVKAGSGLLFPDYRGRFLPRPSSSSSNWFANAARRCGLPEITPHDLRHTAASLAVHAGANVKVVQRMLGHSSAVETLNRYADLFDDDLDNVADRLDEMAREAGLA